MGEEISPTSDSKKSPEMTPQDDGTKVPLTNDAQVSIEEAKYAVNPNGDAKIDVGVAPAFSGLTKEELMKYSTDPFWVRVRWFLFILFWLGWLAMLVMAIVIIVQAPGCKPPPELLVVQENPMLEVDPNNLPTSEDLIKRCSVNGISAVYFPGLISRNNFQEASYDVALLIEALQKEDYNAVTDLPERVVPTNPFYANATGEKLIDNAGNWNYTNNNLANAIFKEVVEFWIAEGVTGFILKQEDTPDKKFFIQELNVLTKDLGGSVGSNIIETKNEFRTPSLFESFLEGETADWNFLRFNPKQSVGLSMDEDYMRLITLGLFMAPGTPMLNNYQSLTSDESELIKYLTFMKTKKGIKFGSSNFVNVTSSDTVAFTRVYKGTPAYAVALNFKDSNETLSFEDTPNVGETGTVEVHSAMSQNVYETREKYRLDDINLGPFEGIILQFVANF